MFAALRLLLGEQLADLCHRRLFEGGAEVLVVLFEQGVEHRVEGPSPTVFDVAGGVPVVGGPGGGEPMMFGWWK